MRNRFLGWPLVPAVSLISSAALAQPEPTPTPTPPAGIQAFNPAPPDPAVATQAVPPELEPRLTSHQFWVALRHHIQYVFVIYQENRSFDSYFGTFPGAEGLFTHATAATPGFTQQFLDTNGNLIPIQPFRIGPNEFASDTADIDHSHTGILAKMHLVDGRAQMDNFALVEELKHTPQGAPSLRAKQFGELTMAYEDGDTIPLLWRYANRFVLFDHIFQQMTGPSTPGNLSIIGAQSGATQWMLHPNQAYAGDGDDEPGVPVVNSLPPHWNSHVPGDTSHLPAGPDAQAAATAQRNLTFATLPLTLAGKSVKTVTRTDRYPKTDLADVAEDIPAIITSGKRAIGWGWYQEGYDREPSGTVTGAGDPLDAAGRHASYVTHHNGPQYFGYIANNPAMTRNLHGLHDFYDDLDRGALPAAGGVFYVKGGYRNIAGMLPANPDPAARKNYLGDDDHPGYSDAQISEAQVARAVNAIAASKYWKNCAIIITWDDSAGAYDHVPPAVRGKGPGDTVVSDGPRVPLILISPYAKAHAIEPNVGDHASVVKFVDYVFDLKPLADLPAEREGRRRGRKWGLADQGPYDDMTANVTSLSSAFDPARLTGAAPRLPASYALIPEELVNTLPQFSGFGWRQIGVTPTDYALGIQNQIPSDFKTLP